MAGPSAFRWSGSFKVLPKEATSAKNLSGDKIILPQSALEQLLAAAPSQSVPASGVAAQDPFSQYRPNRFGFGERQQLPHPLTFKLVNPQNHNVIFAGIREFSAEEGTVGLSPFLFEALGIEYDQRAPRDGSETRDTHDADSQTAVSSAMIEPNQVTVHALLVPKGCYVRLRPLEAGYEGDWKSLLERHLREYFTCLTKNSMLSIRGARAETFKFLVDKVLPEGNGICVVDTDLEVDIEALNEEQARETIRRQMMAQEVNELSGAISKGGNLDIWKDVAGKVQPGGYVDYTLPSWDRSQSLIITLSGIAQEDGLDVFVTPRSSRQRALPRDTTHVFGNFYAAEHGTKAIAISSTNVEMDGAESILISVHAPRISQEQRESEPLTFTIRAKLGSQVAKSQLDAIHHDSNEEQCGNCHQWIPKTTMVLHENFCRRNNTSCPRCRAVFKRNSDEWNSHWHCDYDSAKGNSLFGKIKHDIVFHKMRQCQDCEFSTNSLVDLARHRTSDCPAKLILCRFCNLEVPQEGDPSNPSPEAILTGLTAHELADGGRTSECHLCDKIVRLRDMETHMKHHELDKVSREKPAICRNANCGRTIHGVGPRGQVGAGAGAAQGQDPGNHVGLCAICFGPLYVSMHDPEDRALKRRIERKYLGQMMTGCGKRHCRNEWCKTGRAHGGLEAKGCSASAILPLVKPLVAMVSDSRGKMYFCVDESSQERRKLAESLATEKVWDLEWCVAAAEAEKGDLERMRNWLQAWAPRHRRS
ncbi:hypothetical protein UVI_02042850 [Ustilaginoidea virens]|uniref:Uncharacterized protein n=1 Tax=Ustilaginoidea virens TaxID=1159556 RepID=A0A1B5L6A1_USTVR|nr:hypothetical protein UVI_02042850 [Ustilaginoidea virens]